MVLSLELVTSAQSKLDKAYFYYESQSTGLGSQFLDEIFRLIRQIRLFPKAWPKFSNRTRRSIASKLPMPLSINYGMMLY
jgi:hypothetical protein